MKNNLNFEYLYCFDDNFNKQAFTSIISLLDNVKKPIVINVIHPNKFIIDYVPNLITKHSKLKKLNFFIFKNSGYEFPNLTKSHISEATYYRLFIDKYLKDTIKNIVYVDADMVCVEDPIDLIENKIVHLRKKNHLIAARTELNYKNSDSDIFNRLELNDKYFNAGFMIINFKRWIDDKVGVKLLEIMKENYSKIVFWDQDILNLYINGSYLELDEKLNYSAQNLLKNNLQDEKYFIHFVGSKKPWLTSGAFELSSEIYHTNFRKLYSTRYHIEHKWKMASLKELIIAIIKFKIFKLTNPMIYIKDFIISLRK